MSETTTLTPPRGLSDERKRELVAWWTAIRDGSLVPAPLEIPEAIRRAIRGDLAKYTVRPTEKWLRFAERSGTLDYLYAGATVITFDVPGGFVVLAAGEDEHNLMYDTMPRDFMDRTHTEYTDPWPEAECLPG